MYWKLTTDATSEPITTAQAKTHCRIDISTDDTYVDILIKTARQMVERDNDRAMLTQTWMLYMDDFPASDNEPIRLPRSPAIEVEGAAVSAITYIDTAGDAQTWSSAEYDVDINTEPARILPAYGYSWPSTRDDPSNVVVTYTCGYGANIGAATLLPNPMLLQMYLLIGHWYNNREAVVLGTISKEIELAYYSLVDLTKVGWEW